MIDSKMLDQAERAVLRAYEAGEFQRVRGVQPAMERYRQAAKQTLAKPRSINIRMAERDLQRIKALAVQQGMPYQTFMSALLHQHATRRPVKSVRTSAKELSR